MSEEIKEYLKRVDELELKLTDEDKETFQWVLFGYNECARILEETEQENQQLKDRNKLLEKHYKQGEKNLGTQIDITLKYEKVLDEIRECIDNFPCIHYASAEKVDGKRLSGKLIPVDDLLQILDKVGKE